MAASAGRVLRSVKPHIPMIRFPNRGGPAAVSSVDSAGKSPAQGSSKAMGSAPMGSGVDLADLPLKYQRRSIDPDEMEAIEKGGRV